MASEKTEQDWIAIVDFGSQYAQLIARRVRELGVYCEMVDPEDVDAAMLKPALRGIILSGGPESAHSKDAPQISAAVFSAGLPVLGICYGMQAMATQLGGKVVSAQASEFGYAQIELIEPKQLLSALATAQDADGSRQVDVWMSHGDHVQTVPPGFSVTACTAQIPVAAMADEKRHFYGLQFHPEVTHTDQGTDIFNQFLHSICRCDRNWRPSYIIDEAIAAIKKQVGTDKVVLGLSGGVDSSVAAMLLQRAIGSQLTCIFVDNGLLREGEVEEVQTLFAKHLGMQLITVDAQAIFLQGLAGLDDPEQKRKAVGHAFIEVFSKQALALDGCKFLAQGTIYPDVIESARTKTGKARVIKSHHNVGGLPDHLPFALVEPLRHLFKDEVRVIGKELGLPDVLLSRHPFPGPGLCVRILGEVNGNAITILKKADAIFIKKLRQAGLYDEVSQAFAVFLPVKSVGVKGDGRCYAYVIALRAVKTIDFMTAKWAYLPHEFLDEVSHDIINAIPQVARVVYDISGKPPATIEWE